MCMCVLLHHSSRQLIVFILKVAGCQHKEITSIAQHFNMFHWKTRVDQEVLCKDEFVTS